MGCLCYAVNHHTHGDKFETRSIKSVLMGYSTTQKGYKLYDLSTKTFFISRDVLLEKINIHFNIFKMSPVTLLFSKILICLFLMILLPSLYMNHLLLLQTQPPSQLIHHLVQSPNHLTILLLILEGLLDLLNLLDGCITLSILLHTVLHIPLHTLLLTLYPHTCPIPPFLLYIFSHCVIFQLYQNLLLTIRLCSIHIGFKLWS